MRDEYFVLRHSPAARLWTSPGRLPRCKFGVSIAAHIPRASFGQGGAMQMTQDQFSALMFHLRAMLGLVCLQAAILVGFAWKYL